MSTVAVAKDGTLLDVDESCLQAHMDAGWKIATKDQEVIGAALASMPEIRAAMEDLKSRLLVLEEAKVQLEEDVRLASADQPGNDAEANAAANRIAELEAKKAAGQAAPHECALLGRLKKAAAKGQE